MRHLAFQTLFGGVFTAFLLSGCSEPGSGTHSSAVTSTAPVSATAPASAAAPVSGKPPKDAIVLLHADDLSNWTYDVGDDNVKMEEVWSIHDGILACKGKPAGVLRTKEDYENYVLDAEWRWPAGTPGGNNGILVHTSTPRVLGIWPKSVEVQLQKGEAGDFWIIGTTLHVTNEEQRKDGRRHRNLTDHSEKPMGEWNHIEVTCKGNEIIVKVNGELVNHATDLNVTRGAICLQSEGVPIEYRNVFLRPLK